MPLRAFRPPLLRSPALLLLLRLVLLPGNRPPTGSLVLDKRLTVTAYVLPHSIGSAASSAVASATSAVANAGNGATGLKVPAAGLLAGALGLIVAM